MDQMASATTSTLALQVATGKAEVELKSCTSRQCEYWELDRLKVGETCPLLYRSQEFAVRGQHYAGSFVTKLTKTKAKECYLWLDLNTQELRRSKSGPFDPVFKSIQLSHISRVKRVVSIKRNVFAFQIDAEGAWYSGYWSAHLARLQLCLEAVWLWPESSLGLYLA
jgi:hypothetical protein